LSPHVLSIRFDLVHYIIKHPLESQFVVTCVDKLYRHCNVCKFHLFLSVHQILSAVSAKDVAVTTNLPCRVVVPCSLSQNIFCLAREVTV